MSKGKVYLIGAGPGDIKLITVKGLECIQKADVIVYDRLANPRLLSYRRQDAELIYVGKSPDRHTMTQDEINKVLVEEGLKGKVVARLKGGDPYVFGRGGEEGEELRKAGIEFEEVPGITSAISVPAYAGIPITHRGVSGGFQVYTSQLRSNQERAFDFTKMLDDYCTYVFLTGIRKLEMIVNGFLEAGKNPKTPIAIVSNASLAKQKGFRQGYVLLEDFNSAYALNQLEEVILEPAEKVAEMSAKDRALYGKMAYIAIDSADYLANILVETANSMLLYNTKNIYFVPYGQDDAQKKEN